MPEVVPGYSTEHVVSIVAANESDINDMISARAESGWIVVSITLSGTDVIILFTRTVAAS